MNNKKKNEGQTDFSYYGLYLLDYLRTNKFEQATDTAFIRERADRAAETSEKARLEGYPADGAQEQAMDTLLRGLRYSRYAILREVVESEFFRRSAGRETRSLYSETHAACRQRILRL